LTLNKRRAGKAEINLDPTGSTASRANRGSSVEVIIARINYFVASYERLNLTEWLIRLVTGLALGIVNNLVNNLPPGMIAGSTLPAAHAKGRIADAVLIGVDLGPNLSITGSLATILWLMALRKEKVDVISGVFSGWALWPCRSPCWLRLAGQF
jgi:hypothetical protein